eukprot:2573059-Rhodomonas_salina.1
MKRYRDALALLGAILGCIFAEVPGTETSLFQILPNNPGTNVLYRWVGGLSGIHSVPGIGNNMSATVVVLLLSVALLGEA